MCPDGMSMILCTALVSPSLSLPKTWGGLSAASVIPCQGLAATPAAREVLQEDQQRYWEGAGEDKLRMCQGCLTP